MNENFLTAQDICIEHAAQICGLFGLSDGMARMLALLYMSPEPISIPVICEKLSLTKGTVSLYLRLLEERKIMARAWSKRQGRQKFYEMNPRVWTDFLADMRTRALRRFEITEDAIERSLQSIRKGEREYGRRRPACIQAAHGEAREGKGDEQHLADPARSASWYRRQGRRMSAPRLNKDRNLSDE